MGVTLLAWNAASLSLWELSSHHRIPALPSKWPAVISQRGLQDRLPGPFKCSPPSAHFSTHISFLYLAPLARGVAERSWSVICQAGSCRETETCLLPHARLCAVQIGPYIISFSSFLVAVMGKSFEVLAHANGLYFKWGSSLHASREGLNTVLPC